MKSVYKRTTLIITEFDTEDVITTSAPDPIEPVVAKAFEKENRYGSFMSFDLKGPGNGSWF
ncbi:hypothetical protein [Ruminococcus sp.]|uniref:hypothetical protein n=1 Tax=Ruminococcus sp. TaxID=41978 RepID=UPI003862F946